MERVKIVATVTLDIVIENEAELDEVCESIHTGETYSIYDGDRLVADVYDDQEGLEIVSNHNTRAALEAQVERLTAALEFYADESNYVDNLQVIESGKPGVQPITYDAPNVMEDRGDLAREALATAGPGGGGEGESDSA